MNIKYEKLYKDEQNKNKKLRDELIMKQNEIRKLRLLLKSKEEEMKTKLLSIINSQTAKNGYKEEELVCKDLENKLIKQKLIPILGNNYDLCIKVTGNHKCDIQSKNKIIKCQVKKYKKGQFQQLDRHWISHLMKNIPELNNASQILKDLIEYPYLSNGLYIDKSKPIKKLCTTNYSKETLTNFINLLNKHKRKILEYAFLGDNIEMQPEYLIGVQYENKKRTKIVVFTIKEIISYLEKLNFKISPRKTCILLGNNKTISLQRKGGDCGKKSSNQLQIKIILSNLIDKVPNSYYNF